LAVWNTCYFLFWYKQGSVKTGNDGIGFLTATRKQEVVFSLYIAAVIDALFAYYICVVANYCEAINKKEREEAEAMMMTEPKDMMMVVDEKKDDSMMDKMSNKSKMDMMEPMEDGAEKPDDAPVEGA
jgi:hypothetical protein